MNWIDLCWFNWRFRQLTGNNDADIFISRLIAITIPMIILIILQSVNSLGVEVWPPLLSVSFAFSLLATGIVIMVLGLETGILYPTLIIFLIWIMSIYTYIQFEANLI